jgi:DNA-binding transcriptional regulator YhcF (GntR family)
MAYRHDAIVKKAEALLLTSPALSEAQLAMKLGVHRHTLGRALAQVRGISFRRLRDRCWHLTLAKYHSDERVMSLKELANEIGCSRRTLERRKARFLWLKTDNIAAKQSGSPERSARSPIPKSSHQRRLAAPSVRAAGLQVGRRR